MSASHSSSEITRAAEILRRGGLVAIPTETVYGLAANAYDVQAVARVFEVKQRPWFDPIIVHVADAAQLVELVIEFPEDARRLAEQFWPGPLTIVLPKRERVPDLVTAGGPTVAVRIPDHPLTLELLRTVQLPLAAPSANPFGRISPTTAEHVREQLGSQIDMILDGGPCRVGVESTVVQCTVDGLHLLRPGGVTIEQLREVVRNVHLPSPARGQSAGSHDESDRPLSSPGTLLKHYAPRTPLRIVPDLSAWLQKQRVDGAERANRRRLGLLTLRAVADREPFAECEVLSPAGDLREAAANFFAALRRLDAAGLDVILAQPFPDQGLGLALNDRLRRAAHS